MPRDGKLRGNHPTNERTAQNSRIISPPPNPAPSLFADNKNAEMPPLDGWDVFGGFDACNTAPHDLHVLFEAGFSLPQAEHFIVLFCPLLVTDLQ
jgi:hypothetical protein